MSKLKCLCLGLVMALAFVATAKAESGTHDAVYDKNGKAIVAKSGNCVRTKWTQSNDPCSDTVEAATTATQDNLFAGGAVTTEEATVYFDFDKYNLKASETEKLDRVLVALKAGTIKNARIIGYTDPIGTRDYNQKLSERRAQAVLDYLTKNGYDDVQSTELKGLAYDDLVVRCDDVKERLKRIECYWKNRRTELAFEFAAKPADAAAPAQPAAQ
jgi:outer membrane protein OmpA-like peptidoglycan-associated protein